MGIFAIAYKNYLIEIFFYNSDSLLYREIGQCSSLYNENFI